MSGGSKSQVSGHKYSLGMHLIFIHGEVDSITQLQWDRKLGWEGSVTADGSFVVSNEQLFGGEKSEGGVSGTVDFYTGNYTQSQNAYLQSQLGTDIPAFRGVCGCVLRGTSGGGFYLGNNPYLKLIAGRFQRIHKTTDGATQWYDETAAIGSTLPFTPATFTPGELVEVSWYQSTFEQGTNDQAAMGIGFYNASGTIIGSITYATLLAPPTLGFTNAPWLLRSVSDTIPASTAKIKLFQHMHRRTGTYNNGYIDDISATVNGVPLTVINPGAELGITGWKKLSGGLATQVGPANSGTHCFMGGQSGDTVYYQEFTPLTVLPSSYDMNPSHIIRECLLDPDWGMGYNAEDIDDDSFTASADTLYGESLGISLLWDKQMPLEDFIKEIIRHINAALYVSRTTGKFVLKLIRADYNIDDLLVIDESSIDKVENFCYNAFGELVNSVTVTYWDGETDTQATLTESDPALVQMQGVVIGTTIQYPGFTNRTVGSKIALRDLTTLSVPLRSCTLYTKRIGASLNIGDVFIMRWGDFASDDIVMRVLGMALGDGRSNKVRLTVTQDQFATESEGASTGTDPGGGWTDPTSGSAAPLSPRTVYEAPYAELIVSFGQTEINSKIGAEPELGYLQVAGARNALKAAINFILSTDSGAGYINYGNVEICPVAYLNGAISRTAITFPIDGGEDLEDVEIGSYCKIDDEFMEVVAISSTSITVGRAVLDTVIATHADNAVILFVSGFSGTDQVTYASGTSVNVKMLTRTGSNTLASGSAPVDTAVMDQRAIRPYPPAFVKVNGSQDPVSATETMTITWNHRDRIVQSDTLVSDDEGSVGPETNVRYTLQAYNGASLIMEQTDLSGTTASLLLAADYATLTLKMFSVRDGYDSLYKQIIPAFAYTRGAAGAAYAGANPGSPGAVTGTAAPADAPVNDSLGAVYENATAIIPIVSQIFGK